MREQSHTRHEPQHWAYAALDAQRSVENTWTELQSCLAAEALKSSDNTPVDCGAPQRREYSNQCVVYFQEGVQVRALAQQTEGGLLTPREQECLAWLAAGLSSKQIARQLQLAVSTIDEYIKNAVTKLQANNRTQAVARALLLGACRV